ncbi:MAG: multidrug resistance efflux transporter family protein [Arcobacter sp.]|uniref:multidrug resistance efflux transporter family protein n=1 Tax=Arcobacter sp. TaxID=1872629 RepID=UPI003B00113A
MSVSGGHCLWSATLRYFFMIIFLVLVLIFQGGIQRVIDVCKLYLSNYIFWTISGTVGFGFFYALICFSADFSPGWVIAATWQFTVVATLFVLIFFGKKFPKKIWFFSIIIFIGVCLVNLAHMETFDLKALFSGVFATSIFLYTRNIAKNSNELAAVDATQATEVVFALIGGMIFLGTGSLNLIAIVGLVLIMAGLFLFTKYQAY